MKRLVSGILAAMLVVTSWLPAEAKANSGAEDGAKAINVSAAKDGAKTAKETADAVKKAARTENIFQLEANNKTFESNVVYQNSDEKDRISLKIHGNKMDIDFRCSTPGVKEYRFALVRPFMSLLFAEPKGGVIRETVDLSGIKSGRYYLMISRAMNRAQTDRWEYGDGSAYRVATINIQRGNITIDKYTNIMKNNQKLRENPAYMGKQCYLDKSLKDISFVLTDYKKKASKLTSSEQKYIKKVSDNITEGCDTPYEKARAIYQFVGEKVYYDKLSNEKDPTRAYLHPYRNLKAIVDKAKYPNSTGDGKVATLCTGYSSMTIALLRAQGIPARLIFGYHLNTSESNWEDIKASVIKSKSSHYWTEFYVDDRWMTCDSYMAGANKWERSSFSNGGKWIKRGFTNYSWFNPSEHQLGVSHYGQGVFSGAVMAKKDEVSQLKAILMAKDGSGKYNYEKLGMKKSDIDSQGNYIYLTNPSRTYTERKTGKIEKIDWKNKNMTFEGRLKNLTSLKWLNINGNPGVQYLNVSGDKQLLSVYAGDCRIRNFYGLNCPKLETVSAYGNPLTLAKYNFKGRYVATIKAGKGGTFRLTYKNGVHTVTAVPNRGYRFTGWYKNGKRVTRNRELSVRASASFERRAGFVK